MNQATDLMAARAGATAAPTSRGGVGGVANWIKQQLLKLGAQIWQLISRLLTPKEWTLKGSLGTGPFGLANAEVSITFGK